MPAWTAYILLLAALGLGFVWGQHSYRPARQAQVMRTARTTAPVDRRSDVVPGDPPDAGRSAPLALGPFEAAGELGVLREHIPFPGEVMSHEAPLAPMAVNSGDAGAAGSERLAGWVVDDHSGVLAGACLKIFRSGDPDVTVPIASVCTGAKGDFSLGSLPATFAVLVEHPSFASSFVTSVVPAEDHTFTLRPGGGLSGSVVERSSGGAISAWTAKLSHGPLRKQLTGNSSELMVTSWPAGESLLQIDAPGFVAYRRKLQIPEGESLKQITLPDLQFELHPAAELEIRVVDHRGDPVPDAQVSWKGEEVVTDAHGVAVILRGEAGKGELHVHKGGRVTELVTEVIARQLNRVEAILEIEN